ncbi:MAG: NAD(P)H-hydrate epimerase [Corynebacterium sp.]|uniref:NAD(P)H-hydrate epimerase n=1 Tax=Corynebacterium sp. TaxID=1720 RepID=UPI0026DFCC1C|nr:NAD(P)H-hydrate epimerase [Corynebacterium sp.]MDO5669762.1 NAD(P)H-hydrate epimerase [Corynebacterium sp.]
MILPSAAYPVSVIRACEQVLLDAQSADDQLMRQAAHAVALAARTLLKEMRDPQVLLLVGAGGNGGDALYAGAELAADHHVDAVLLGREGRVHERALAAFDQAGGTIHDKLPDPASWDLIIDGILGIGGSGGLSPALGAWLEEVEAPIVAVDVPSGVDADTGACPAHHITADVTVTFGGLRHAHAVSTVCGEVLVADIGNEAGELGTSLLRAHRPIFTFRALPPSREWPFPLIDLAAVHSGVPLEPGADDDKYSGGVLGVCAGSETYPGAGYLTTIAAVRATSSMVRYVGPLGRDIVREVPEVVISGDVASTGRVQAWVVGPGRGTDEAAAAELAELLARPEPLLIDADAITLLAQSPKLRAALRSRDGDALLTPHAGEFTRLAEAIGDLPEASTDPLRAVRALAAELRCAVLLKGRRTIICLDDALTTVDAGSSWAATPGSGDVLAGLAGAWIARAGLPGVLEATSIHGNAAWLSAQTVDGPAPTSASRIAEAIPQATAKTASP